MLTKHYLPRAYMNSQNEDVLTDLIAIPLQLGYAVVWDFWHKPSAISSLDTGKIFVQNCFYYHKSKMNFKDCLKANRVTLAVYESLLKAGLFTVTSREKQFYSAVYDRFYEFVDLPRVLVRVYSDKALKDRQEIRIEFDGNQLKSIESDTYLTVLNHVLSGIDENLTALTPTVSKGWLVYQLKDNSLNYRLKLQEFQKDWRPYSIYLDGGHSWDLSKQYGALITGASGTGKTGLLYGLIYQLLQKEKGYVSVCVADGKNDELGAVMSQVLPRGRVAVGVQTVNLVHKLVELSDKRYTYMAKKRKKNPQLAFADFHRFGFKMIVLILDEQSAVMASVSDSKTKKQYQADLLKLVQTSRASGIIPIVSMQQANANSMGGVLGTAIREQLTGLKIVMGSPATITTQDRQMVLGAGVELPPTHFTGVGSGFLQTSSMASPEPFQAPLLPKRSEDLYKLLRK